MFLRALARCLNYRAEHLSNSGFLLGIRRVGAWPTHFVRQGSIGATFDRMRRTVLDIDSIAEFTEPFTIGKLLSEVSYCSAAIDVDGDDQRGFGIDYLSILAIN